MPEKQRWDVFYVTEGDKQNFWHRCGVAFDNNDGSINVILEAVPLGGKVQLRRPNEKPAK